MVPKPALKLIVIVVAFAAMLLSLLAVRGFWQHPSSDVSVEPILLHASGACLAKIIQLEEYNEMPSDGDHWVKACLDISQSSGTVPDFLYLVVQYGGHRPIEVLDELKTPSVLRHDSLKVGERHWFVFSEDFDSTKYPQKVAGWWPYKGGSVPREVITAIKTDRFAGHPVWDKTLNVVYEAKQLTLPDKIHIRVRDADSLDERSIRFETIVPGNIESVNLNHWATTYEMEWPEEGGLQTVSVATTGDLSHGTPFNLPAGTYRINYAFDLTTGRTLAIWIAKNQEILTMLAFQQYDRETGETIVDMKFEFLPTGGLAAGSDSGNWYRRIVRKYNAKELQSEQIFRHQYIKTGKEPINSSSGWLLIDE